MGFGGRLEKGKPLVDADGNPPVIHRGAYDGTRSEWTIFVNSGGIAEAIAFVP